MVEQSNILVVKRDGTKEPLNIEKIHKVVTHACAGLAGVSPSEVELTSQLKFFDGMKTTDIQETLIKAAVDLISEDAPNYQFVAGRLINYQIRKEVFGHYEPGNLYDHVRKVVAEGYYTSELLNWYTKEEFDAMDSFVDHDRDEALTYAAMEQFRGKYLVKNRVTNKIYETPQIAYILIAATAFNFYPKAKRLKYVRDYYDMVSKGYISLATPVIAGVRTPDKQFSSCTVINCGDSLKSINATSAAIVSYVSERAGIGLNVGRIRAIGSPVKGGRKSHTGIIPYLKLFYAATASCSQGGIRKGSTTVNFPIWHYEVEDLIVLKNNKGTEENRIRHMDYCVQINKLFYERLIKNEDITLFCPNDVPEMYEAFFADQEKFKELYERAERNTRLRKKKVKAQELFTNLASERKNTGRIYISNVDNVNNQGAFRPDVAPVYQTNLCAEISLPNTPLGETENDEIALCTLSAINWGKIDSPEDFQKPCEMAVRGLDALLTYQDYPVEAAKRGTENYRPLGVGIINLAYWLAKNNLSYEGNSETYKMVDEFAEAWAYYLTKASIDLAKEYGPCKKVENTKYHSSVFPIDTYNKNVDSLVSRKLSQNWEELKKDVAQFGIRNATLMALMPAETSATVSNATNGIEPPRGYISIKQSKSGNMKQVVPGYPRLKNKYQLLWDLKSPEGYLNIVAILQKYVDQAISVNTSYNPEFYPDGKIPMSELLRHILMFYKFGGKNLYYNNTKDGQEELDMTEPKSKEQNNSVPEDCESCKL